MAAMATATHSPLANMGASLRGTPGSTARRTFKDKLLNMLEEAELQEADTLREAQSQDKKSLSIACLLEGRPGAFVDFFNVSHGAPGGPSTSGREEDVELPQEALLLLKAQLTRADQARLDNNVEAQFSAFKVQAKYFLQLGRLRHAEFFLIRAQWLARGASWVKGDLEAGVALGAVYEELQVGSAESCMPMPMPMRPCSKMHMKRRLACVISQQTPWLAEWTCNTGHQTTKYCCSFGMEA